LAVADRTTGVGMVDSSRSRIEPENQGRGFDFVKFAEACGATGERVTDPKEIRAALRRAVDSGVPYVIDIIIERETDASMGVSIDAIKEFE
jgi:tartronate-semialdehyde synthase